MQVHLSSHNLIGVQPKGVVETYTSCLEGSNRVATRIVISIRNLVIERLLGLLHAVVCVISSA